MNTIIRFIDLTVKKSKYNIEGDSMIDLKFLRKS